MSPFYREEPEKLNIIHHLEELRKRILISLGILAAATVFTFSQGDELLAAVKRPLLPLVPGGLIFISPAEAFTAYLKISLLAGFIISFPFILYHVWTFISPAVSKESRKRMSLWFICSLMLFLAGIAFSYYIAVPAALKFLINFGSDIATPRITLGSYTSFFGALVLAGGTVFEIPVIMVFMADTGLLKTRVLKEKRHLAVIGILIFAAVITPTQDIFNMLLFALPMILLYEAGLFIAVIVEKRKKL